MWQEFRNHPAALVFSLTVHAILVILLVISFDWTVKPSAVPQQVDVIQATAVDNAQVEAEIKKLQAADTKRKREEQARLDKLKREADAAKRTRAEEEKRLAEVEKKQAEEKLRLTKLKREQDELQKKSEAEKQRLAEAERKRKLEEDKRQKAEAARKQAEAEKKRAEDAREKERKRQLAEQLEAEERAQADAAASKSIAEYTALIRNKVSRSWLKPAGNIKGLKCVVRVSVIPGGDVVRAQVTRSSGNSIFDRSVEAAVFKASPLPLPDDPAIAARMREIDFEFVPEG